ncbi:maleylpyruvate isomerase N-terminal domain-containing protein [Citricoccus alkalitolerans]|uniref:Maleylpyruvate isomerase N-terminal domain-containing protein n=1 Tax=Citricoccus alkalitolerans TaxID=246603 RepID=A0ABV8XWU6_9MICC
MATIPQQDGPDNETVEHYRAASTAFLVVCRGITDWEAPGLGVWTVRSLAGHTNRSHTNVTRYLEAGPDPGAVPVDGPVGYFAAFWEPQPGRTISDDEEVADRGRQAGEALGREPLSVIERDRTEVLALLESTGLDAELRTPAGTMTLAGYLATRIFELTVHTMDMARATGQAMPTALAPVVPRVVRLAADLAVARGAGVVVAEALTGRGPLSDGFTVL